MGIYMFLVKKLPIASQMAPLWSFGSWAMPNTETFSMLWPLFLCRGMLKCCLPFCVTLQWASRGGSKPLVLHKDTVIALGVESCHGSVYALFSLPFSPKCGTRRNWTPSPWEHSWEEEKFLVILLLHVPSSDKLCNWFTSLLSTPEQIRGR